MSKNSHTNARKSTRPTARKTSRTKAGKKKRSLLVRISGWVCGLMAISLVLGMSAFGIMYMTVTVPHPGEIQNVQRASIRASDGITELAAVIPAEGNRREVTYKEIPDTVLHAVMAAEDRDFEVNKGFSIKGFGRAVLGKLTGRASAGGGSTITQQYVKNAVVGSERTYWRKFNELVISAKMAKQWSKEDIMTAYLNTIYFGRGAYGIGTAARIYFDKDVSKINTGEAALLAAVIQAPSRLDPAINKDLAVERWNYVLNGMVTKKWLSQEKRQNIRFPHFKMLQDTSADKASLGPNGLVKTQVLDELHRLGFSDETITTTGMKITSSIDNKTQNSIVNAVEAQTKSAPAENRTAVVSVDPRTGAIRGYYGGSDGVGYDFANAPLMTGSTFKVFGLAAALDQDIPLSRTFSSAPYKTGDITINNSEGMSCGVCTIAKATKLSLNTSFYRLQDALKQGPHDVAAMAHKVGIPEQIPTLKGKTLQEPDGSVSSGIILGQYGTRALDMASAYGTFAASGVYHEPFFVQKVEAADGKVLFDRGNPAGERRVSKAVADNVSAALSPIAAYSNGRALGNRPSAAKTGTVQLGNTGQNRDAWMIGYTPSLSTAVWTGTIKGTALVESYGGMMWGAGTPGAIWQQSMMGALEGTDVEPFSTPDPIAGQAGLPVEPTVKKTHHHRTTQKTTTEQPQYTRPTIPGLPGIVNPFAPMEPVDNEDSEPAYSGQIHNEDVLGDVLQGDEVQSNNTQPQNADVELVSQGAE